MREAAHLAVAPRECLEVREGVRVGERAVRRHAVAPLERLAEVHRQELRVRVGDVQQRDVAERRHVVQLGGGLREARARAQRGARQGGDAKQLQEFSAAQRPILSRARGGTTPTCRRASPRGAAR